jgi:ABC-type multidrug transport system fused ATPase/permease subunit
MAKKVKFLLSSTNWISQILFLWIIRLVYLIHTLPQLKHLHLSLDSKETAQVTGDKLEENWEKERLKRKENASLMRALASAFGLVYLSLAIWKLLWIGFIWVGIYFALKGLIQVQQADQNYTAHYYALGLFLSCFLGSLCFHQLAIQSTRIGIRCRAALMVLVYRKSLKLSYVKGGVGDVVNLISNDCNRIAEACVNGHYLWSAFLECIVIFVLSIVDIGISAIPANILILVVLLPLQYYLARKASAISYEATALITKRVRLLSEMLTAIKLIKFYAWEDYFLSKVNAARKKEVEKERGELINKIAAFMTVFVAPILAVLITLGTYYSINGALPDSAIVFSLLALYNTLRYPLLLLPSAERTLTGANISISRLEDYLKLPEIDAPLEITERLQDDLDLVMSMKNASFTWDGDLDHPHISNLTLNLHRNQIVAVVGDVGSGKSLFAAILGQLKRTNGDASLHGKIGYVPQEPWLIDATIKDNILFGLEVDDSKYADTLRLVELTRDLILLSNGIVL